MYSYSHYETLGVKYDATPEQIQAAFVGKFTDLVDEAKKGLIECQADLEKQLSAYPVDSAKQAVPHDLSTLEACIEKIKYNKFCLLRKKREEVLALISQVSQANVSSLASMSPEEVSRCTRDLYDLFSAIEGLLNFCKKMPPSYAFKKHSFFQGKGYQVSFFANDERSCITAYRILTSERQDYNRKLALSLADDCLDSIEKIEQNFAKFLRETEPEALAGDAKPVQSILTSLRSCAEKLYESFQSAYLTLVPEICDLAKEFLDKNTEVSCDMLCEIERSNNDVSNAAMLVALFPAVITNVREMFSLLGEIEKDRDSRDQNTVGGKAIAEFLNKLLTPVSSEVDELVRRYSITEVLISEDLEDRCKAICKAICTLKEQISSQYESAKQDYWKIKSYAKGMALAAKANPPYMP